MLGVRSIFVEIKLYWPGFEGSSVFFNLALSRSVRLTSCLCYILPVFNTVLTLSYSHIPTKLKIWKYLTSFNHCQSNFKSISTSTSVHELIHCFRDFQYVQVSCNKLVEVGDLSTRVRASDYMVSIHDVACCVRSNPMAQILNRQKLATLTTGVVV